MASIFGHIIVGYSITKLLKWNSKSLLMISASISAFIPDLDVIGFNFGIPYESVWGHRGITHSFFFAVLWGGIIALFFKSNRFFAFLALSFATASHAILDAMTTGGLGVAFFAPFENSRYFFSFRPITVSPMGVLSFISYRGALVLYSELIWVALPCAILLFIRKKILK